MIRNKRGLPPIFYITVVLLSLYFMPKLWGMTTHFNLNKNERISSGNHLLIAENSNPDKEKGIQAFAEGKTETAVNNFQKSLSQNPNDPETVAYLNNTQVGENPLKIAVVIPIGSNENIAQEILRGVTTAVEEFNQKGGINGRKILIVIVNDDNDPEIARQVASELVKDSEIIAVIGHNASNPSIAAAPVYQKGGLVMITPTSFANNLSGIGDYIFRIVPNTKVMAETLADYIINTDHNNKIAFCYDSQALDSVSFKDEFMAAFISKGGQFVPIVCDLSTPNFEATTIINQAFNQGAKGLFVVSHIDRVQKAIDVIQANRGKIPVYSSPTLYNITTLEKGQDDAQGLILTAPWHPQVNPYFAEMMRQRWQGTIGWRTATAYDATKAIITGLQQNQTRKGLQTVLRASGFSLQGVTGNIRFDPSTGDRIGKPVIIQVQSQGPRYAFVLRKK